MIRTLVFVIIASTTWIPSQALCQEFGLADSKQSPEMTLANPFKMLTGLFSADKNEEFPQIDKFFKDPAAIEISTLAVKHDLERVKTVLASGQVDLNAPGYLWATPMHFAMVWSTPEIITEFVRHGADPIKVAYSHGSPLQVMLTNTKDSTAVKMAKVQALVAGGSNINSAAFTQEINNLTFATLNNEVADALLTTLFDLGLKPGTRDYHLALVFGHYHNLDARLDHGAAIFDSGEVDWPLGLEIYRLQRERPQEKRTERLLEKLRNKGVTLAMLEQRYGQNPSWQNFRADRTTQRPDEIDFYLEDIRGMGILFPAEMKRPISLSIMLVGRNALLANLGQDYLRQAIANLSLRQNTWHEKPRELRKDMEYLQSLPVKAENGRWSIIFDAFIAFPEWKNIAETSRNDSIVYMSSGFDQTSEQGKVWPRRDDMIFSTGASISPVFETR
jgi:hypothetical protein